MGLLKQLFHTIVDDGSVAYWEAMNEEKDDAFIFKRYAESFRPAGVPDQGGCLGGNAHIACEHIILKRYPSLRKDRHREMMLAFSSFVEMHKECFGSEAGELISKFKFFSTM